jgi:hypothetical protein
MLLFSNSTKEVAANVVQIFGLCGTLTLTQNIGCPSAASDNTVVSLLHTKEKQQ